MNLIIPKKITMIGLFFFLVTLLLPIVDNLTGALFKLKMIAEGAIGSPSQLMRFGLFVLLIWLLDNAKHSKPLRTILLAGCYLLLIEVTVAGIHMNLKAFLSGIVFSIKLLFSLSCYYYVAYWLEGKKTGEQENDQAQHKVRTLYVIRQLVNYGTLVSILVLVAYFSGFHIPNYRIGLATRGLFVSGNGLGVVLGISTILLVHFRQKISLFSFLHILLLLLTTALLGTKASLIFLIVALALLSIKLAKQAPLITAVAIGLISVYLLLPLIELLSGLFESIIYKFNNIDNKLSLIASSRDIFIGNAFAQIDVDAFNALRILFGGGSYYAYTDYGSGLTMVRKALENDLFELFFSYGIVLVIAYLGIYTFALKESLKKRNWVIAMALTLAFLHSATMGHVLSNGTATITYALCLALASKGARLNKHDF